MLQINFECLRNRKYRVFTVVSLERRPKKSYQLLEGAPLHAIFPLKSPFPLGLVREVVPAKPLACDGISPSHLWRLDRCRGADNASRDPRVTLRMPCAMLICGLGALEKPALVAAGDKEASSCTD